MSVFTTKADFKAGNLRSCRRQSLKTSAETNCEVNAANILAS